MFKDCLQLNCNLSKWNVRNVQTMFNMFNNCQKFTGDGLETWKPINVVNLKYMFAYCSNLNIDTIENWDLDALNNIDADKKEEKMSNMFFRSRLTTYPSWYKK
jgi:surface protein